MTPYATDKPIAPAQEVNETQSVKLVAVVLGEDMWTAKSGAADLSDKRIILEGDTLPRNVAAFFFSGIARRCRVYQTKP